MSWLDKALALLRADTPCTLVTIAGTAGSTPREAGTRMLVWADGVDGTIGGGHLELAAIERARQAVLGPMLRSAPFLDSFGLGPELAQCCGGRVRLLFEPLSATDLPWLERWAAAATGGENVVTVTQLRGGTVERLLLDRTHLDAPLLPKPAQAHLPRLFDGQARAAFLELGDGESYLLARMRQFIDSVYLFGAGHVGRALARALEPLPYRIVWIDSRAEMFPERLPANVTRRLLPQPAPEVEAAPAGTLFLVMTHSHPLDLEICDRVLRRGDFAYLGLIGSDTKRARFLSQLRKRGHGDSALARLICPIGVGGITGKEPAVIAIAAAAQMLQVSEARRAAADDADQPQRASS
jgi:xanthine dehydrogenase accessory factor